MSTRWGNLQRTVLWLSLLWPLGCAALEVPPTLLQILPPEPLVQSTLQESLALQSASAGVDRAHAEAALRRRGPHEASVNAEWLRRDVDQEGRFGEWNVGMSKAIRWPDKRAIDQATATRMTELAHAAAEDIRHQVAMDLLQTWMQWRVANELVQSALTREEASQREWQAIDARWRVGQASAAERDALTQLLAEVRAEALVVQQRQQAAEAQLRLRYPRLIPVLSESLSALPAPENLPAPTGGWWTVVEQHSHELEVLRQRAAIADLESDRQAAERHPDPTLGFRVLSERDGAERGVGLTFSIPLGTVRRGLQAQQAAAAAAELGASVQAEIREMKLALAQREQAAAALWQQWQAWQDAAIAAESRATRLSTGWALGEVSFDVLVQARRSAAEVRTREIEARASVHAANAGLFLDAHAFWLDRPSHESHEARGQPEVQLDIDESPTGSATE